MAAPPGGSCDVTLACPGDAAHLHRPGPLQSLLTVGEQGPCTGVFHVCVALLSSHL